jgi:tRNA (Thr-GGU) A37 N-methylase
MRKYLDHMPRKIPAGKVLFHNGVVACDTKQRPNVNGFRVILFSKVESFMAPCDCGWSGLPHYRPARQEAGE